ncbi:hypothetical protein J2S51_000636 [Streptomyces sp. DSM 41269]|nr:hypothetical protein [Streptomyces sp. DSM 41269]
MTDLSEERTWGSFALLPRIVAGQSRRAGDGTDESAT